MKMIETILEIFGWLMITLGITAGFGLPALLVYIKVQENTGEVIALILISTGFILGALWATHIWKKHGTIAWLSGIRRIS